MPRRPPLRAALAAITLGAIACTAACTSGSTPAPKATGPVAVPLPSSSAAPVLAACRALTAALPAELSKDVRRRPVTADATRTAAWGDPAVTLQCGVPLGDQTQTPLQIDGFPLVTDERGDAITYTTVDRAVNVAIRIPKSYQDQGYLVLPLIAVLKKLPTPDAAPGA